MDGGRRRDQEGNEVLGKSELCCRGEEWAQVWVSWPWLVWLVKTMVCGLRRWVKCCCLQGKGTHVEVVCAGDEAELSLGAGDGADPWQGVVGGCRRVSLGWTSHTPGNRHCRTVTHPVAACSGGPLSSSVTVSHEGSAQLPSARPGDVGHPFLLSSAGPLPWPTQTSMCSEAAVLPCVWSVPLSCLQGHASCAWGMSPIPRSQGEDASLLSALSAPQAWCRLGMLEVVEVV